MEQKPATKTLTKFCSLTIYNVTLLVNRGRQTDETESFLKCVAR